MQAVHVGNFKSDTMIAAGITAMITSALSRMADTLQKIDNAH